MEKQGVGSKTASLILETAQLAIKIKEISADKKLTEEQKI
jgi:hypothetical protein